MEEREKIKKLMMKTLKEYPDNHKFTKEEVAEACTSVLIGSREGMMRGLERLSKTTDSTES